MLDAYKITNILFAHADGYSVNVRGDEPTTGYMVGGYVPSLVLSPDSPRKGHPEDWQPYGTTDRWLTGHELYLAMNVDGAPLFYAGIWTDHDSGLIYVDLARNVQDLSEALAVADNFGEIAIWDVENKREIRLSDD